MKINNIRFLKLVALIAFNPCFVEKRVSPVGRPGTSVIIKCLRSAWPLTCVAQHIYHQRIRLPLPATPGAGAGVTAGPHQSRSIIDILSAKLRAGLSAAIRPTATR